MPNRPLASERTPHRQSGAPLGQVPRALTAARKLELVPHAEPVRIGRPEETSRSTQSPPAQSSRAQSSWATTFGSLMEGFLLYGASLHPNAAFPAGLLQGDHGGASAMDTFAPQRTVARQGYDTVVPTPALGGAASGFAGRIARSLRGSIAGLWARWRRERAIRKTVAALADLDDRTLYDMGIPSRHHIEEVVRYCRDC